MSAYYLCFLKYKQSLLYHFRLINHSLVCRKNHERHCIKVTVIIIQIDVAHKSSLETCFLEKFYRLECYSLIDLEFNSIFTHRMPLTDFMVVCVNKLMTIYEAYICISPILACVLFEEDPIQNQPKFF